MTRQIESTDSISEKITKIIPAEIVAAYLALQALLIMDPTVAWIVIGALFILTFFYLRILGKVTSWAQTVFSAFSFLVWVYSIAPEQILGELHNPIRASIVVLVWALLIPFIFRQKTRNTPKVV